MAATPSAQAAIRPDWSSLWLRTQRSCITTLDLARILIFDAIVLVLGNGVIHLTSRLAAPSDEFFQAAHKLSQGLFLLLYFIVVCFHVVEFIVEKRHEQH